MTWVSMILALVVALEHYYILYLELFQPTSEAAQRTFGLEADFLSDKRIQTLF